MLITLLIIGLVSKLSAQIKNNKKEFVVETIDGDLFYGSNTIEMDSTIVLKTTFGEIKFFKKKVFKITTTNDNKKFKFSNPNPTRYFFGPSAISLEKKRVITKMFYYHPTS